MILSFAPQGDPCEAKRHPLGACFPDRTGGVLQTQSDRTRSRIERDARHRTREALELQLIRLGVARPEQQADALLREVAR